MTVIYRPATFDDAANITQVYLSSRKTFLPYAPLVHSDENIRKWITNTLIPTERVSIAEINSNIIGMMSLSEHDDFGWIDHLYLDPTSVGFGIGSSFVDQAKDELKSVIRLYAFQKNVKCRHFYERHGFQAILSSDGSTNEEKCPDVLYEFTHT